MSETINNKHLESVFKSLLPALECKNIDYWVFAGVGIAGCIGHFIRKNKDVDIFVKESNYDNAISILKTVCSIREELKCFCRKPIVRSCYSRPKFEVRTYPYGKRDKIFSIIPIFEKSDCVTFVFEKTKDFQKEVLHRVTRVVQDYKFISPPDESIKQIFLYCLSERPDWIKRKDKRTDGRAILTPIEFDNYFQTHT
ncbi:hypothetical protein A3K42_00355 [candidate division WWE3 bacterium RBG_13_37_7]|uniref:LicD family protein n=1 Tax=candidate division WWE3 bacterium RBG_13_37_7 TaxID=1802609 RepID=A0A1F4U289_UNCKA|nr:MAG: hypothetical protein A3K42_00355 [candidate division WWE3 bacterium RBG_13_37_7]